MTFDKQSNGRQIEVESYLLPPHNKFRENYRGYRDIDIFTANPRYFLAL